MRYNLDTVVAPNSRMKGERNSMGTPRSAVLAVDMSRPPAAGTLARSAGPAHVRQQVSGGKWPRVHVPGLVSCVGASRGLLRIPRSLVVLPWALSVFAFTPQLENVVRYFGVGSVGAKGWTQVL